MPLQSQAETPQTELPGGELARRVVAEACRRNFYLFARLACGFRFYCQARPDDAWFVDRIHKPLCDWLQAHVEDWEESRRQKIRKPKKILICIPRGYGKTTLMAAFQLWLHVRQSELSTSISSYDEAKSIDLLRVIQSFMSGATGYGWFKELYGGWEPVGEERVWRKEACTHMHRKDASIRDPSFFTTSVVIGLTGFRPDVFLLDDPIVEEKLVKETNWVEKARKHLDAVRPAIKTNGLWLVCLTRYRDDDVASKILMDEKVESFARTGMRPREDDFRLGGPWNVFFMSARDLFGNPTLPEVWPEEELKRYETEDPAGFSAQMMNYPAEGQHMPVRREHIERLWVHDHEVPWNELRYSVHIDTAFKDREKTAKGDYSSIQVWGHFRDGSGRVAFRGAWQDQRWNIHEFTEKLVAVLKGLYPDCWPFVVTDDRETGGHAGSYEQFLQGACYRAGLPCPPYMPITRSTKKSERIRTAAFAWVQGKVMLPRQAPGVDDLKSQMLRIDVSAHDDLADPAADVFHPEVYVPERGPSREPEAIVRPYDALMCEDPAKWRDDEIRLVYDVTESEGAEWTIWPGLDE